jgi:hypothetical protein
MRNKKLDALVLQMENYSECWKHFSHYLNAARAAKFDQDDEAQFLELKSLIVQELELITASVEFQSPRKDDVLNLLGNAPSMRFLSEQSEGALRTLENHWHKIYIAWQSNLGQLKVQQRQLESQSLLSNILSFRKAA